MPTYTFIVNKIYAKLNVKVHNYKYTNTHMYIYTYINIYIYIYIYIQSTPDKSDLQGTGKCV